MGKLTGEQLVEAAQKWIGTPYVYGMKGQFMTESAFNYLRKTYPGSVPESDRLKIGKKCIDCSGLISVCTGAIRGSGAYHDSAVKILPIKEIDKAVPGCAVWKRGHIGIYAGNGEIIEARSSRYGVVRTKVSERDFTHILWLLDINYTVSEAVGPDVTEINTYDSSTIVKDGQVWANQMLHELISNKVVKALEIDGSCGPKTKKALVMCLQMWHNRAYQTSLAIDGSFGPKTKKACRQFTLNDASGLVIIAKIFLAGRGYRVGSNLTSICNMDTYRSVKTFQKTAGLKVDGWCGPDTLNALINK